MNRPPIDRRIPRVVLAAGLLAAGAAGAAQKIAFVTSAAGTGDLSTWPQANGLQGLAAGDQICRTLAQNAGLPSPTQFVAWLSDGDDDAYCRLHGLAGKKVNNCGQPSLPVDAGPWERRDGPRFAGSISQLVAGVVYGPLDRDELGHPVGQARAFTDTSPSGARSVIYSGSCSDWTSSAFVPVGAGDTTRTTGSWTAFGGVYCDQSRRLYCLQGGGAGPALSKPLGSGRLAFLTSAAGTGQLGSWPAADGAQGIAAGDAICQTLAQDESLPHATDFVAWLSDDVGGVDAIDRFVFDGPFVRPDGTRAASSLADLTDGALLSSIHQSESGSYFSNHAVWTGTGSDGNAGGGDCLGWTSAAAAQGGRTGLANAVNVDWTANPIASTDCDFTGARLYCLGDYPDPNVFFDGFETGNTALWSATVP